jgi:hypothetical protein
MVSRGLAGPLTPRRCEGQGREVPPPSHSTVASSPSGERAHRRGGRRRRRPPPSSPLAAVAGFLSGSHSVAGAREERERKGKKEHGRRESWLRPSAGPAALLTVTDEHAGHGPRRRTCRPRAAPPLHVRNQRKRKAEQRSGSRPSAGRRALDLTVAGGTPGRALHPPPPVS